MTEPITDAELDAWECHPAMSTMYRAWPRVIAELRSLRATKADLLRDVAEKTQAFARASACGVRYCAERDEARAALYVMTVERDALEAQLAPQRVDPIAFLTADLGSLNDLLAAMGESRWVERIGLESRKRAVEAELAKLRGER